MFALSVPILQLMIIARLPYAAAHCQGRHTGSRTCTSSVALGVFAGWQHTYAARQHIYAAGIFPPAAAARSQPCRAMLLRLHVSTSAEHRVSNIADPGCIDGRGPQRWLAGGPLYLLNQAAAALADDSRELIPRAAVTMPAVIEAAPSRRRCRCRTTQHSTEHSAQQSTGGKSRAYGR